MTSKARQIHVRRVLADVEMIDYLCTSYLHSIPEGYGMELSRLRVELAEGWPIGTMTR